MKTDNDVLLRKNEEKVFNYLLDSPKDDLKTWERMRELSRLGLKEAIKYPHIFGEETSQETAITWGIDTLQFLNLLTFEVHNYMMGIMGTEDNPIERREIIDGSKKKLSKLLFEDDCTTHFDLVHLNCLVLSGLRESLKVNENDQENDNVLWLLEQLISDLDNHTVLDWECIKSEPKAVA